MLSVEKSLLAYHLGRPILCPLDFSEVTVAQVTQQMSNFTGKVTPDNDALAFYLHNHAFAQVRSQVGDYGVTGKYEPVVVSYLTVVANQAQRMFYYLMAICTRESRHLNGCPFAKTIEKEYGSVIYEFHKAILHTSSSSAVARLFEDPPGCLLPEYTQFLEDCFFKGKYNGGYGGKAWGDVAKVLNQFVQGEITAEMMLDLGYALAHNNGPIFNKGIWYKGYTAEFISILDVQRAGQIPQLFFDHTHGRVYFGHINGKQVTQWKSLSVILGGEFLESMNWSAIQEAGALGSVSQYIKKQIKFEGGTAVDMVDPTYDMLPGVSIPIFKRTKPELKPISKWENS